MRGLAPPPKSIAAEVDAVLGSEGLACVGEINPSATFIHIGIDETCPLELGEVSALGLASANIPANERNAAPVASVVSIGKKDLERCFGDIGHFNSPFCGGHLGSQYNPYEPFKQKRKAKKHFLSNFLSGKVKMEPESEEYSENK